MHEQFPPPRHPSESVDPIDYPATHRLLVQQVDMQVADLRVLFQLPVAELDPNVGGNFTVAAMMLNLISGFSRWFFHTDEAARIAAEEVRDGNRRSRQRFIGFVEAYWPDFPPEPPAAEVAQRLYDVRNSLSHDLGLGEPSPAELPENVALAKRAFALDDIVSVERTTSLHPLTSPVIEERAGVYVVHLLGVYWALHRMLHDALRDRPDEIEKVIATIPIPEVERLDQR